MTRKRGDPRPSGARSRALAGGPASSSAGPTLQEEFASLPCEHPPQYEAMSDSEEGLDFSARHDGGEGAEGEAEDSAVGAGIASMGRCQMMDESSDDGDGPRLAPEEEDAPISAAARGWRPGWTVGEWISAASPPCAQAQVLVCNVCLALHFKRL